MSDQKEEKEEESLGTFWEHLEELRRAIISIVVTIAIGSALAFTFHAPIIKTLSSSIETVAPDKKKGELQYSPITYKRVINSSPQAVHYFLDRGEEVVGISADRDRGYLIAPDEQIIVQQEKGPRLQVLSPTEGLTTAIRLSFWIGLLVSSPIWMLFILRFVSPALKKRERGVSVPFLLLSLLFIGLGITFSLFVTLPLANQTLSSFNARFAENLWSLGSYTEYLTLLLLSNALAFELCLLLLFLVHLDKISSGTMRRWRKQTIVVSFVLSAILTPPDIFSQIVLALPLIFFYESAILYAKLRERGGEKAFTTAYG